MIIWDEGGWPIGYVGDLTDEDMSMLKRHENEIEMQKNRVEILTGAKIPKGCVSAHRALNKIVSTTTPKELNHGC